MLSLPALPLVTVVAPVVVVVVAAPAAAAAAVVAVVVVVVGMGAAVAPAVVVETVAGLGVGWGKPRLLYISMYAQSYPSNASCTESTAMGVTWEGRQVRQCMHTYTYINK